MSYSIDDHWKLLDGALRYEDEHVRVDITPQNSASIYPCSLAGSDFTVFEWDQYNAICTSPIDALRGIEGSWRRLSGSPGVVTFMFRNRIGLATMRFQIGAHELPPCRLNVLSSKFPTEAKHESFLTSLLYDLTARTQSATFVPEAATAFSSEADPRGPTPLSDYHTLLRWSEALPGALEAILHDPHRVLAQEGWRIPIEELSTVDASVIEQLVQSGDQWIPTSASWPVAKALGGHVPRHLWVDQTMETLDNPENRLVVRALDQLEEALGRIQAIGWLWQGSTSESKQRLLELGTVIEHVRMSSFLGELKPVDLIPHSSQVLARRVGYREVWQCWQELTAGRRGILGQSDHAIANRDIAKLYELWCFFALANLLGKHLGAPRRYRDIADDRFGVRDRAVAEFDDGWSLVYNRGYRRPNSYSVGLRPDFTLTSNGERLVAFDAKFRFEVLDCDSEETDQDSEADERRRAIRADIYKMHTYRDALGLRSALVVYPGTEDLFYPKPGSTFAGVSPLRAAPLVEILDGSLQGVGAIALLPQAKEAKPT